MFRLLLRRVGAEGEHTFYIDHGRNIADAPNKSKIRKWVLDVYPKAKRVEPEGNEFTIVEFDI